MRYRTLREMRAVVRAKSETLPDKPPENPHWLSELQRLLSKHDRTKVPKESETLSSAAWSALENLFRLAENGNADAAVSYAYLLCRHVETLNALGLANPKLLRAFSRKCLRWPILKSPAPLLSQDEKRILKQLEIGKDSGRFLDQHSKWKPDGHLAQFVDDLLKAVDLYRRVAVEKDLAFEMILFQQSLPACFFGRLNEPKFRSATAKLKPFSKDSVRDWERIIVAKLKDCFVDPVCADYLSRFVTAPSKRKSVGHAKQHLIRRVRERLHDLTGSK